MVGLLAGFLQSVAAAAAASGSVEPTCVTGGGASADDDCTSHLQALVARKSPRTHRGLEGAGGEGLGSYFAFKYGSGYSWNSGVVVSDVVDFGGAAARAVFGVVSSASIQLGLPFPPDGGQASVDGILGLAPGCFSSVQSRGCTTNDDLLSSLVAAGQLSEFVFSVCLRGGTPGGGRLFLGPADSPLPPGAVEVPMRLSGGHWFVRAPVDGSPVVVSLGGETVAQLSGVRFELSYPLVDSGTGGLLLPPDVYHNFTDAIIAQLVANGTCSSQCKVGSDEWSGYERIFETLQVAFVGKECGECIKGLVPDLHVDLGPNGELIVDGSTFLYQTTPCSGQYMASWYPAPDTFMFGTALLIGKNVQFNVVKSTMTIIGPSEACAHDYSQGGNYSIDLSGAEGQLLAPDIGVVAADLLVGTPPQKFVVQVDTGSPLLILPSVSCVLYGLPSCQGSKYCESCFYLEGSAQGGGVMYPCGKACSHFHEYYYEDHQMPRACVDYTDPLLNFLNATVAYGVATGFSLSDFANGSAGTLQPWASCQATRDVCGDGGAYCAECSSTVRPKGAIEAVPRSQFPIPKYTASVRCEACPTRVSRQ